MPTTARFDELYRELNPRQREAVDAIDGPVMVIAGPGTGKTKLLTVRIANILAKTDTPPEAILALTFTESGASEMKGRLAAIIGPDAYRVEVTTFHAFCNRIIQQYPESFAALAGAAFMTEADQAALLSELIMSAKDIDLLRPVNAPDLYLKAVQSSLSTLKREGVDPSGLGRMADDEQKGIMTADDLYHTKGAYKGTMKGAYQDQLKQIAKLRELSGLYGAYQEALRTRRLYDYDDMVLEVARALERDDQLRLILQEQHQYILVDEHQDTNNAQNRVIELLASFWERPNVFVVGDAKQAIFRFQGASLENFMYFKRLYPRVKLITLEHNYRSSQLILDAAAGVQTDEAGLSAAAGHESAPVEVMALSTPDVQYWTVAQRIRERVEAGIRPEEIAVLARDNADAVSVAEFLEKLDIPFTLSSQLDVLTDPFLHQLLLILDAVASFGSAGPLLEALHAPTLAVEPLDLYKLMEFCRGGRNPYDVMRSAALMHEAGIDGADVLKRLAASLSSWSRRAAQPDAAAALEAIVRESGILAAIVADPAAPDILEKLHAVYDMLRANVQRDRSLTLRAFTAHLAFLRERGIAITAGSTTAVLGRVRVMTAHKSKGLEFDEVIIVDAADSHWGARIRRQLLRLPQAVFLRGATTDPAAASDDDERNLFYVALTRARKHVLIAYPQRDRDGSDELPVRYIADISPTLIVRPDTAPYEESWARGSAIRFAEPRRAMVPPAEDAQYLAMLFERQGLSVTALNNYLECPWRYFYTSLLRIPEAPVFALMYGNAVDRALTDYFDRLAQGERGTKKDLLASFEGFARHQAFPERELATALTRGTKALGGYFDRYHETWKPNVINQLRIPAVDLDGVILNGKIDKVELLASPDVLVTDYKTGKPKSRAHIMGRVKDGDGNYFRQLVFYKLLLDRYQNGKYRMHRGVIDFVEPDDRGKWHREEFEITPTMVGELEAVIGRVASEIRTLAFWDRRCDDRDCEYCRLRDVMQKKDGPAR